MKIKERVKEKNIDKIGRNNMVTNINEKIDNSSRL